MIGTETGTSRGGIVPPHQEDAHRDRPTWRGGLVLPLPEEDLYYGTGEAVPPGASRLRYGD